MRGVTSNLLQQVKRRLSRCFSEVLGAVTPVVSSRSHLVSPYRFLSSSEPVSCYFGTWSPISQSWPMFYSLHKLFMRSTAPKLEKEAAEKLPSIVEGKRAPPGAFLLCSSRNTVQPVDRTVDYVEPFSTEKRYDVDLKELQQKRLHPDLFSVGSEVGILSVPGCTKIGGSCSLHGYLHQRKQKIYGLDKQVAFPRLSSPLSHGISQSTTLCGVNVEQLRAFVSEQSKEAITDAEKEDKEMITVTFVDKEGDERSIIVPIGMSILEAAHQNDIELEGACEGSLACSTCHVIVMDEDYYQKLPEPTDEENDMLDLAFGLTETSRLGCQVIAKPELDGIRVALPVATRNFAVDGHIPKPH